jgi:hypothetical protein
LAFGIDAWWAGRQDDFELEELMVSLRDDLAADRQSLIQKIQAQEETVDRIARLLDMTDAELLAVPADSLDRLGFAVLGYSTFDSQSGTLDGLIATGRVSALPSEVLTGALLSWKARVDDLEEEKQSVRAAGQAASWRVAELGGPWATREFQVNSWTSEALRRLPATDLTTVRDAELRAHLRHKRHAIFVYLVELVPLLEQTDALLQMLDEELE